MKTDPTLFACEIRNFILEQSERPEFVAKDFKELFQISKANGCAQAGKPSKPGTPKTLINDVSEKAFQRAIFQQCKTDAAFPTGRKVIEWLDYELPVLPGTAARRRSCDLIGRIDGQELTICEAKFCQPNVGNIRAIAYAVLEVVIQMQIILLNYEHLGEIHHLGDGFTHFNWADMTHASQLLVVANKSSYVKKGSFFELTTELVAAIQNQLRISVHLFKTEDITFQNAVGGHRAQWPFGIDKAWIPGIQN